jgi:hypothetical protein
MFGSGPVANVSRVASKQDFLFKLSASVCGRSIRFDFFGACAENARNV